MCIIALKPAGVDMISDEEIKYMFNRNHDGAGFALQGDIYGDGRFLVEYHKGFMNVDDLIEALGPKEKLKNLTVAIHCRIKTSGLTNKENTHPFPISNQYADLRKLDGSGAVLFHNGVISGLGGIIDKNASDTQDFVVGVATRYLNNAKQPRALAQKIVEEIAGLSRLLILYPKKNFPILKYGQWFEHKGCYYSNQGYLDDTPTTQYATRYGEEDFTSFCKKKHSYTDTRTDLDQWGRNNAEYAWPSPSSSDNWIHIPDKKRWEALMKLKSSTVEKEGREYAKFPSSSSKVYIIDEEEQEIYIPLLEERVEMRRLEENYVIERMEEGGMYYEENGYLWFQNEEEFDDWLSITEPESGYTRRFLGQVWFVDRANYEAYTEEGIKDYFKTGEIGHVKRELKEYGMYVDHNLKAKYGYGYPTEDDDDDATPLLATTFKEEVEEEKELLNIRRKI